MLGTAREGVKVAQAAFEVDRIVGMGREFVLSRPIRVNVTRDIECFVATSRTFTAHGTGSTVEDALMSYMEELIRYFDWLIANERGLAPVLQKELKTLKKLMTEVR